MPRPGESPQNYFVAEPAMSSELSAAGPPPAAPALEAAPQVVVYVTEKGETMTATTLEEAIHPIDGPGCTYLGGLATRKAEMLFKLEAKGQAARAAQLEVTPATPNSPTPAKPKSSPSPKKTTETKPPSSHRPESAALSRPAEVPLAEARHEPVKQPASAATKSAPPIEIPRQQIKRAAIQAPETVPASTARPAQESERSEAPPASRPLSSETSRPLAVPRPRDLSPLTEQLAARPVELVPPVVSELSPAPLEPAESVYSPLPGAPTELPSAFAEVEPTAPFADDVLAEAVFLAASSEAAGETGPPFYGFDPGELPLLQRAVEERGDGLFDQNEERADQVGGLALMERSPFDGEVTPPDRLVDAAAVLDSALPPLLHDKLAIIIESADDTVLERLADIQLSIVESIGQLQALVVAESEPEHLEAIEALLENQCLELLRVLQVEIDEQTFKRFISGLHEISQPISPTPARRAGLDEGMHEHKQNFGSIAQDFSQAITEKISAMKLARFMVHTTLA